jgi:hypothetical protein
MHECSQMTCILSNLCIGMANWMDVFYQELLTTSEATEDEAWELVSACIKKVFEELQRVRASATNATSELDASS